MLFSVIIPLYNKEDTIARALKSVAAQEFKDFEVIVVDDGSKDGGVSVVEGFEGIERLRIIRQENAGVSAARNRGVREAMGVYMAFLDADDCWKSRHLRELSRIVELYPDSVLIGSGFYWNVGDRVFRTRESGKIEKIDLIAETAIFQPVHTSSIAVRRKEFVALGGFDERHGYFEDVELMFKLALRYTNQVVVSRRALVCHLNDAASSITKDIPKVCREAPHLELINRVAQEKDVSQSVRRFAQRHVLKTFADNSFRFRTVANVKFASLYSGLIRHCNVGRIFVCYPLSLLVWPLAVVVKAWYRMKLRRVR